MPAPLAPVHSADHARGPEDARVTVVQYGDYECPHTRKSNRILVEMFAAMAEPPRFVFRHFPLRHMHADAEALAEIAEAAGRQGKFWEMHDHLMQHAGSITRRDLLRDADAVGVDLDALRSQLGSDELKARVEADVASGKASGVHSTPTFFNGVLFDGHYDEETIAAQLAAAEKRAG